MRLLVFVAVVTGCGAGTTAATPTRTAVSTAGQSVQAQPVQAVRSGQVVWVKVAVATLWTSPSAPRHVDAKAVSAPVDIRGWLAAMSNATRRDLAGRVETQALYGDRLLVTGIRTGWLHVVAPNQPTTRDRRGYPGWVPTRQVTTTRPLSTTSVATVTRITTWLRSAAGARVIEVGIGTRLPVVSMSSARVAIATPTRARLYAARADVVVAKAGAAALSRSASAVLATARTFLGRPYLWGGRSGFAVDCSGFTELVYAMHGIVIPRDADDQARAGRAVTGTRPADLVFFRDGSTIGHVGFLVSGAKMLHAPHTGSVVQIGPLGHPVSARRFL